MCQGFYTKYIVSVYLFTQQILIKHLICCYKQEDIEVKKAASSSLGSLDLSEKENK